MLAQSIRSFLVVLVMCAAPSAAIHATGIVFQDRFEFIVHDSLSVTDISHLSETLNESYDRIKNEFGVEALPTITVQVWSDEEHYQSVMEEAFGRRFPGSGGYVAGPDELRLLYRGQSSAQKEAVHEFAHVVSLNLDPEFGNNPRWLWEAVAIYHAGEFRDPGDFSYMRDGNYPTINELDAEFNSNKNIYDVGYLLAEYIVSNWGRQLLIDLILSHGDIESIFDVSPREFENGWHEFVEEKYLVP